jgi:hypothetical protein
VNTLDIWLKSILSSGRSRSAVITAVPTQMM